MKNEVQARAPCRGPPRSKYIWWTFNLSSLIGFLINRKLSFGKHNHSNTFFLKSYVTAKRRPRKLGYPIVFDEITFLLKFSGKNRGGLASSAVFYFFLNFQVYFIKCCNVNLMLLISQYYDICVFLEIFDYDAFM